MRDRSKRKVIMYSLMVALMITTVAYALLQTSLNINGSVTKQGGKWNIYFDNPVVVEEYGDAVLTLPDTFPTNTTTFDFSVLVVKPSDYVTFTVDVVNGGTLDAVLDSLTLTGITDAATQDVLFTVKYVDDSPVLEGDMLPKGERRTLKLTVEYDENSETLASENVVLNLGTTLIYVQTVGDTTNKGDNPGIIEGDTSLALAPNLLNNSLTPVVYDANYYGNGIGSWVVADTTTEWYNYSRQQWANAVILNSGVTKKVGDPVIVPTVSSAGELDATSEVKAMYVWIPRYEYKIEGQYGTYTDGTKGTAELPGEIEVNFIPQSQTTATPGYILHPAFTWNVSENYDEDGNAIIEANEHLTGIWVGKFETTGTGDEPTILPNTSSLRSQSVSAQFATAQKLGTYLTNTSNTDSHMMKNSEWGAVAYLSQSIYGKYGNSMYAGTNKEVYQNKSSLTGNSNGTPSQAEKLTQCTYDNIVDRGNGTGSCGGGASTTGNIYGVYDMSGGAYEFTMGYLTTAHGTRPWGSTSSNNYAGFTEAPAGRYFDAYTTTTSTTACNGGICYGHALSETAGWYSDYANFVLANNPWVHRGGNYIDDANAGVWSSRYSSGIGLGSISFRSVLFAPGA